VSERYPELGPRGHLWCSDTLTHTNAVLTAEQTGFFLQEFTEPVLCKLPSLLVLEVLNTGTA
jgi:hypothetical protein